MNELELKSLRGNVSADELLEIAEAMFSESRFAKLGEDRRKLFQHCGGILDKDEYIAVGLFSGSVLVGMCIGVCGEILPFTSATVATQHYLYLSPDYRRGNSAGRLLYAFAQEAKKRGAIDVVFSNGFGDGPEKVGKLFEHCGLRLIGGVYTLGD